MQNSPQKPAGSGGSRGYFVFAVLFTIVAAGVWFLVNRKNLHEFSDTYRNRESARVEIAKTVQRIALLKRQQQSLAYNGVESEKQIRERLQMHLPGEKVVFFEEENKTSPSVKQSDKGTTEADKAASPTAKISPQRKP